MPSLAFLDRIACCSRSGLFALAIGAAVALNAYAQSELPIEDDELVGIAPAAVVPAEQARRLLDAAPPPGLRGAGLIEFLQRQIEAASALGAAERRLQLVRRAAEVAPGSPQHWSALTRLIAAERGAGNFAAAETLRRQLLANPIAPPLGKTFLLLDAARWRAGALDIAEARREYEAAQALMHEQLGTSLPAVARQRLLAENEWTQG
ncbi:MAG TPA: hypothetical protein VFR86_06575, partial [Burkholderiaceae bacterium]|nr:hypothetical protein [Burkholderiaceae bacterium]